MASSDWNYERILNTVMSKRKNKCRQGNTVITCLCVMNDKAVEWKENQKNEKALNCRDSLPVKLAHSHLLLLVLHMSDLFVTPPRPFCAFCIYHPVVKVSLFQQYKQGGLQTLVLSDRRNEFKLFKSICIICLTLSFVYFGRSEASISFDHFVFVWKHSNLQI